MKPHLEKESGLAPGSRWWFETEQPSFPKECWKKWTCWDFETRLAAYRLLDFQGWPMDNRWLGGRKYGTDRFHGMATSCSFSLKKITTPMACKPSSAWKLLNHRCREANHQILSQEHSWKLDNCNQPSCILASFAPQGSSFWDYGVDNRPHFFLCLPFTPCNDHRLVASTIPTLVSSWSSTWLGALAIKASKMAAVVDNQVPTVGGTC